MKLGSPVAFGLLDLTEKASLIAFAYLAFTKELREFGFVVRDQFGFVVS